MPHSLPLSNLNNLGRSSNFFLRPGIKFSILPNMLTIIKNNNKTLLSVNNKKETLKMGYLTQQKFQNKKYINCK